MRVCVLLAYRISWSASCGLINRTQATTLPLRRRLYWTLRFPSWYNARSWHNATLAMQRAFTKSVTTFVNWNSWQGRFYQPAATAKDPNAGTGDADWFTFAREQSQPLLWTEGVPVSTLLRIVATACYCA
eukprot:COSAG01_NODE_16405_length_1239_cov_1.161404_1_plen_130_part_00